MNVGTPLVDNWNDNVSKIIYDELQLTMDDDQLSDSTIDYNISSSNAFSRIYSRINKSPKFTYIDNESYYGDTTISLVYKFDLGKATLSGDLSTEVFYFC